MKTKDLPCVFLWGRWDSYLDSCDETNRPTMERMRDWAFPAERTLSARGVTGFSLLELSENHWGWTLYELLKK